MKVKATLGKYENEWHILTVFGKFMLCRFTEDNCPTIEQMEETKQVDELTEEVCPKCVKAAMNHYRRDDEQIP